MKKLLPIIAIIIVFADLAQSFLDIKVGLTHKWGIPGAPNTGIKKPMNIAEAKSSNYSLCTNRPTGLHPVFDKFDLYCTDDKFTCLLFDNATTIAGGVQLAISQETFTPHFNMTEIGFTNWTFNSTKYWVTAFCFSKKFMEKSAEERISSYDNTTLCQDGYLYLNGPNKSLIAVPVDTTKITNETLFTKQNHVATMGGHFFYNMRSDTECTATSLFPYFMLTHGGKVVGCGLVVFGNDTTNTMEAPGAAAVKMIVPNGPQCVYDLGDKARTYHMYMIDKPWNILTE